MPWDVRLVNREWWYSVVNFIWKVSKTHYGDTVDKAIMLSCGIRGSCEELPSCCRQGPRSSYPGALPSELQGLLHPIGTRRRRISGEGIVVVQSLSCVRLFLTPWTAACQTPLSFAISWSLLKFMSTESVMPSNHLILCRPLQSFPASGCLPRVNCFFLAAFYLLLDFCGGAWPSRINWVKCSAQWLDCSTQKDDFLFLLLHHHHHTLTLR